ncbi:MFS transporter [Dactylosporangium sp. CS-033363]|uniref:MFS transporter n=1 Tax=Dactylosporangium sp. CS-033363 TaxID=3239935 RepID=UPI003D92CEC7
MLAIDAASFAVLALTYRWAVGAKGPEPATTPKARTLSGLLVVSFVFFLVFGPFYVALPLHVADDLHASATLLGLYYTAFGIGAVVGGLATAYLRRLPQWPATIGIILAFGLTVLPLGLGAPAAVSLPMFGLAGLCWAPYVPMAMALFQRTTPADRLPQVLATFGSITVIAVPLGTAAGGPLVTALGAEHTLLLSAIAMVTLGLAAAIGLLQRRLRQ